jgi:hypothetical protein
MMNAQHNVWLEEALALVPERYRPEDVRPYLTDAMRRCHSKSRRMFWAWLRIQLAKTPESAAYLSDMQESHLQPEVTPTPHDDFPHEISADGTTALIKVGEGEVHGIWKIPVSQLPWARTVMPVFLKKLPDLEPVEVTRQRSIRHQARYMKAKLSVEQLKGFEKELKDLDAQVARLYTPVARYELMKRTPRKDIAVHRLYVGASDDAEVEVKAVDGDFLNFCPVQIRVTLEPVVKDGIAGGRGETETRIVEMSNIQIVPRSEEQQQKFEKGMFQIKHNDHGELVSPYASDGQGGVVRTGNGQRGHSSGLGINPNWDLGKRTGVEGGRVEDCGKSAPLTKDESREWGLLQAGSEQNASKSPSIYRIRKAWGLL